MMTNELEDKRSVARKNDMKNWAGKKKRSTEIILDSNIPCIEKKYGIQNSL